MTKIIYFTAGEQPTTGELAEIAKFNAAAVAPFELVVRRADVSNSYGAAVEATDYVAGTPAAPYDGPSYDVADPDNPPTGGNLPAAQAVVYDGQVIAVTGGSATITVAAGVVTEIVIA